MSRHRTRMQVEADGIDLALSRLSQRVETAASEFHRPDWDDVARRIHGFRGHFRREMHPDDARETT